MQVPAATMHVAHTFEVIKQAEVTTVVRLRDVYPICHHCINGRQNTKPRPYLHLWGRVWVVLMPLVPYTALRLGHGSVTCRLGC